MLILWETEYDTVPGRQYYRYIFYPEFIFSITGGFAEIAHNDINHTKMPIGAIQALSTKYRISCKKFFRKEKQYDYPLIILQAVLWIISVFYIRKIKHPHPPY